MNFLWLPTWRNRPFLYLSLFLWLSAGEPCCLLAAGGAPSDIAEELWPHIEARLDKARTLLEDGTYRSIVEVAAEVGYSDARSFTRSFKNRFGKLPSAFSEEDALSSG